MSRYIAWTDNTAVIARVELRAETRHPGLGKRMATWILAVRDRRRAEALERLGWDLEARCARGGRDGVQRDHHVVLPPGGGLY